MPLDAIQPGILVARDPAVRVPSGKVHGFWRDLLTDSTRASSGVLRLLAAAVEQTWQDEQAADLVKRGGLESDLAALAKKSERLLDVYLAGDIARDVYLRKSGDLETRQGLLNCHIHDLEMKDCDLSAVLAIADGILVDGWNVWQELATNDKQRFAQIMFGPAVRLTRDGIETGPGAGLVGALDLAGFAKGGLARPGEVESPTF